MEDVEDAVHIKQDVINKSVFIIIQNNNKIETIFTKTITITIIKMFNPIFKVRDWIHLYSKELFDKLKTQLEEYTYEAEKNVRREIKMYKRQKKTLSSTYVSKNNSYWDRISVNPDAIDIIERNLDKVDWFYLSLNPSAIHIIELNLDKINWKILSMNPNAVHILEKNLDKIDWEYLSLNPNAIHLLEKNLDKIDWDTLSSNKNAIHILEKNLDKVDWYALSKNPGAIYILEQNIDNIVWSGLLVNTAAYTLDTKAMKQQINNGFAEELIMKVLHPKRLEKNLELYGYDIAIEEYI